MKEPISGRICRARKFCHTVVTEIIWNWEISEKVKLCYIKHITWLF